MNEFYNLDKAIEELNKKYGTDFKYKCEDGKFWIWDANEVYTSEWYYNNVDYKNEVDPILEKLNEAVVNDFGSDELFIDYKNNVMMYVSGVECEDNELVEDDRYDLSRRGEVARSIGTEVSGDNSYTEGTRKVLEKIGKIAKAVAKKLGWDEGLVFQDMVRDLQLLGNPRLVEQLDPSNPVDQLTKQILEMQLQGLIGNGEDYDAFKSSTLTALMNMDENQAAEQLYRMFNRGQISGSNAQRLGGANRRMLGHRDSFGDMLEEFNSLKKKYDMDGEKKETDEGYFQIVMKDKDDETYFNIMTGIDEEGQIIEQTPHYAMIFWRKYDKGHDPRSFDDSKEDDIRFAEKFGENNLTRYKRLSQKLVGNNRDITWVIAHIENADDLNEMMNVTEFGEYTPIAENEEYIVFDINSLEMCQDLAKGANWCITSPTAYNTNARFGAKYHFYINKITGDKYCVAMAKGMNEIVDKNDNELAKLPTGVPQVGEGEITSSVVKEDMSSSDALLKSALANVGLLPVDTLRIAYDDMFGEELDMLDDEEVKDWLLTKLPEVDTNELKEYIEDHIDDFAVLPEEAQDYTDEDEDLIDLEKIEEDEEILNLPTKENLIDDIKSKLASNTLMVLDKIEEDGESTHLFLKFTDEAYELMSADVSDSFYGQNSNITIFDEENVSDRDYFEVLAILLNDEEDRIWIYKDEEYQSNWLDEITDIYSDENIKKVIEEQNELYE